MHPNLGLSGGTGGGGGGRFPGRRESRDSSKGREAETVARTEEQGGSYGAHPRGGGVSRDIFSLRPKGFDWVPDQHLHSQAP